VRAGQHLQQGADKLYGGPGNEVLGASFEDRSRDIVHGSPSYDECYPNKRDVVSGCEQKY
jgi:hypothetical protein